MSNKVPNDPTLQTTKQMLDELDALMEKMLSLPVSELDDAPFPQAIVKAPSMSATLTMLARPEPKPVLLDPMWPHPATNPPHITLPPEPLVEPEPEVVAAIAPLVEPEPETVATIAPPAEAAPQPTPFTNDVTPPTVMPMLEPLLAAIPDPPAPLATQWGYLPLVWINHGFDSATTNLGQAGHWLRGQAGRMVLGVSGVALMLVAAGWFLKDWLGWNW